MGERRNAGENVITEGMGRGMTLLGKGCLRGRPGATSGGRRQTGDDAAAMQRKRKSGQGATERAAATNELNMP
jgi:hypothetical protein